MKDIFISYARSSQEIIDWVHKLAEFLTDKRLSVWYDKWDLKPGDDIQIAQITALQNSQYVIAVCTTEYKKKLDHDYFKMPFGVGYEDRSMNAVVEFLHSTGRHQIEQQVIPVLLEDVEECLPAAFSDIQALHFTRNPLDAPWESFGELVKLLKHKESSLLALEAPKALSIESGFQVPLTLTLDADFDTYDANRAKELLHTLSNFLNLEQLPKILNIEKGSVKITVEIPMDQAKKLVQLREMGMLSQLGVKDAKIIGDALSAAIVNAKARTNQFDVFMCHNSEDKPEIKKIAINLRTKGVLPWLDEWELRPGLPWQVELERQIGNIRSAAVFVGNSGMGPWQNMEVNAFIRKFVDRQSPVIPAVLRSCKKAPDMPIFLNGMTWVDFHKKIPNPYEHLIWGITGEKMGSFCCP